MIKKFVKPNAEDITSHAIAMCMEKSLSYAGSWLTRFLVKKIDLPNDSEEFPKLIPFLQAEVESGKCRLLYGPGFKHDTRERNAVLYNGKVIVVRKAQGWSPEAGRYSTILETQFFATSSQFIDDFLRSVRRHLLGGVEIFGNSSLRHSDIKWVMLNRLPIRSPNSFFYSDDLVAKVVDYVRKFEASEERNIALGIPHHTGILFTGLPGTGKSTLVHVLASVLGKNIYQLDLSQINNLGILIPLLRKAVKSNGIVILEDLDATGADVEARNAQSRIEKKATELSLSVLLNAFDGSLTPSGLIIIGTTNYPENIDPALLRPGRFDVRFDVGKLGKQEFTRMTEFFGQNPEEYDLDYFEPMSGAEIRTLLLTEGVEGIVNFQKDLRNGE